MSIDRATWIETYLAERKGHPIGTDRFVHKPSGMSHEDMHETIADPAIAERGLEVMADFMAPEGSLYYDAIFGGYHGQKAIREWLIPAMQQISFIAFEPRAEAAFIEDGAGGTTVDEWEMVAKLGDTSVPLSRGCSVRKYRDGWIQSAVDVYDTMSFRMGPPPGMAEAMDLPDDMPAEAQELPPPPPLDWPIWAEGKTSKLSQAAKDWISERQSERAGGSASDIVTKPTGLSNEELCNLIHDTETGWDFHLMADMMHPTESVYIDPIFGEFKGQKDIRSWLTDIMGKVGNISFDPLGPVLFNGDMSIEEWVQVAVQSDGTRVPMTRGTSIRRYKDGWVIHNADYFDAASLSDPEVQAAGIAAGSTITLEDIARYRPIPDMAG